jgi:hypothetical protein
MTAHDSMSIFCVIPPLKIERRIKKDEEQGDKIKMSNHKLKIFRD